MDVKPVGSRPSALGPSAYFSGEVWIDHVADASIPNIAKSAIVSFKPGARTAWHTHPLGQTLFVLSGMGLAQTIGQPAVVIRPGDTIWIPPGEKHWHGATATTTMVHLAMQETRDGVAADWLEHVSEAVYASAQPPVT
jgi:quercetin dioxygenase-like cupin family protein